MLQLPLFITGTTQQSGGPSSSPVGAAAGLQTLLEGAEVPAAAFAGELQALLLQLSPPLQQRLEQLVAGGMDLPLAARGLLGERGAAAQGGAFAGLLENGLAVAVDQVDDTAGLLRLDGADAFKGLIEGVTARPLAVAESGQLLTPMVVSGIASGSAPPIAPQLAASLLDMSVPQQVGTKGWDSAIADRLMWMVQGDQQFARLKLNPPNLGPLEVRLTVSQDQSSVAFLSQHAAVREALEAALPRLREMFDQQSLQLVRADVSDPGAHQGDRAGGDRARSGPGGGDAAPQEGDDGALSSPSGSVISAADGLVDLFA